MNHKLSTYQDMIFLKPTVSWISRILYRHTKIWYYLAKKGILYAIIHIYKRRCHNERTIIYYQAKLGAIICIFQATSYMFSVIIFGPQSSRRPTRYNEPM